MKELLPFLKILRIHNALIAAIAVSVGFWLSGSTIGGLMLVMLMLATIAATGFGNVINDIQDIESDRISHPDRPLPKGDISIRSAKFFSVILILISLGCGFTVSITHGIATLVPLVLLTLYALFLKGTPLTGNVVVALLVAYSILYGALTAPEFYRVIYPALFAFLLNIAREIAKDIQDEAGDRASGVITTAILPHQLLRTIIYCISLIYTVLLFVPFINKTFGLPYLALCSATVLPLHLYRTILIASGNWKQRLARISMFFKIEMLCGLAAIALDRVL